MTTICAGSLVEKRPILQSEEGGSSPAPALQFCVAGRKDVKAFVEKWHYSKSINGVTSSFCFSALRGKEIAGAAIFGLPAFLQATAKYGRACLELRRFCLDDVAPKNSESQFLSFCLRWLRKNSTCEVVVSYADKSKGHLGGIYRAANFQYLGATPKQRVIVWQGREFQRRIVNQKTRPVAKRVVEALAAGDAKYQQTLGKEIFLYQLR